VTGHDPLCPEMRISKFRSLISRGVLCECYWIRAGRADERKKVGTEANAVVRAKDERIADLLEDRADLRTEVKALQDRAFSYLGASSYDQGLREAYRQVLALIDGGQ